MRDLIKRVVVITLIVLTPTLYAQGDKKTQRKESTLQKTSAMVSKSHPEGKPSKTSLKEEKVTPKKKKPFFLEWINSQAYAAPVNKKFSKKELRERWKEIFGWDVFYPYFKTEEMKDWVKDKTKVNIFKIKGKAKFHNKGVKYIFKMEF